mmetsp:Transcript_20866/g.41745  ORF Transcript_20866/g.41745 Transcript_20866/m.41745 type:complete len:182 (+) Transcript_20866:145-690(+)
MSAATRGATRAIKRATTSVTTRRERQRRLKYSYQSQPFSSNNFAFSDINVWTCVDAVLGGPGKRSIRILLLLSNRGRSGRRYTARDLKLRSMAYIAEYICRFEPHKILCHILFQGERRISLRTLLAIHIRLKRDKGACADVDECSDEGGDEGDKESDDERDNEKGKTEAIKILLPKPAVFI